MAVRAGMINAQYPQGEDSQLCSDLSTPEKKVITSLKKKKKKKISSSVSSLILYSKKGLLFYMKHSAKMTQRERELCQEDSVMYLCVYKFKGGASANTSYDL